METVVVGIGNVLASDDAVGLEVVRALAARKLPAGVRVIEAATAGLGLIELLLDADRAILVDAVRGCGTPGAITRLEEADLRSAGPRPFSAHDLALPEALALARALFPERMPREILVVGIEVERLDPCREGLSPPVRAAVPRAVEMIEAELRRRPSR